MSDASESWVVGRFFTTYSSRRGKSKGSFGQYGIKWFLSLWNIFSSLVKSSYVTSSGLFIILIGPLWRDMTLSENRTALNVQNKTNECNGNCSSDLGVPYIVWTREFISFQCLLIRFWRILLHCCLSINNSSRNWFQHDAFPWTTERSQWVSNENEVVNQINFVQWLHETFSRTFQMKNQWKRRLRMKDKFLCWNMQIWQWLNNVGIGKK